MHELLTSQEVSALFESLDTIPFLIDKVSTFGGWGFRISKTNFEWGVLLDPHQSKGLEL